jgi:predicted membrane protein
MDKIKNIGNREGGRVIGGLILVAVGVTLLLRNMGFMLPGWLFSWPMILILVGIYSGVKHNFKNNSWIILIGVGGFFLVSEFIPALGLEPLFWPMIIIGAGLLFILRPGRNSWHNIKTGDEFNSWKNTGLGTEPGTLNEATIDRSDYLQVRSVFSGVKRNVVSKNFQGGNIACVFGGAEIDLSQAEINGKVTIKLEMAFGGAKIVVPAHWAVQNEIDGVFHNVDDKRRFNPSASINPDKVLVLKGSAVFGGVEIRSY